MLSIHLMKFRQDLIIDLIRGDKLINITLEGFKSWLEARTAAPTLRLRSNANSPLPRELKISSEYFDLHFKRLEMPGHPWPVRLEHPQLLIRYAY